MSELKIDLSGKVALITGGSRGIGRRTAELMGAAGAHGIAVNYFSRQEEAESLVDALGERRCIAIQGDVGNPEDVERMVETTVDTFGRIDILVNNAAIFDLNEFDREDYGAWV